MVLLVGKMEVDEDDSGDACRAAVYGVRAIAPCSHGLRGGGTEGFGAAENLVGNHLSVRGDESLEYDLTLHLGGAGGQRVIGIRGRDDVRGHDVRGHGDDFVDGLGLGRAR